MKFLKKWVLLPLAYSMFSPVFAQNSIPTAFSFLLHRPDARSAGMGDVGLATSPDAFSLNTNSAKIAFVEKTGFAGLAFVPIMRNLVSDVNLFHLSGFKKVGSQKSMGISLNYMNYGKVELADESGQNTQLFSPSELSLDVTYAQTLSPAFGLAYTARLLHSNSKLLAEGSAFKPDPATALAVDVSAFWNDSFRNGRWAFGASLSNVGTKVKESNGPSSFLPMSLNLGVSYQVLNQSDEQQLHVSFDVHKLLVPTPPRYDAAGKIIAGKDPNRSVVSALFTSFGDAPGGFSEELKEYSLALGFEYEYLRQFSLRTGYFYENPTKGARKHFALGVGAVYKDFTFDVAYVMPSTNRLVLSNSLKFSVSMAVQ